MAIGVHRGGNSNEGKSVIFSPGRGSKRSEENDSGCRMHRKTPKTSQGRHYEETEKGKKRGRE